MLSKGENKMKQYLKDLSAKKIIENLKKGLSIENDNIADRYFMIDNIICHLDHYGNLYINSSLPFCKHEWFFEVEEPFGITETGLYKTKDGRQVYISLICRTDYQCEGVIKNESSVQTWNRNGEFISRRGKVHGLDIVSKWEE